MAYEISSSVAAATFTTQNITASFAGASFDSTPGGKFSPDGTKLAQSNYYYNGNDGSGDVDSGIDIYQSSSESGWTRTESINAGAVVFYEWRTDSELWGIGNNSNKIYKWTSSSVGGWSSGQADSNLAVEYTAGDEITRFKFNNDKDKVVAWYGQDDDNYNRLRFWLSSSQTSGVWDSTGPSSNLVFDRNIFDIEWGRVNSSGQQYMHMALPDPASGQGRIDSALMNSAYSSFLAYGYEMNGGSGRRVGGSGIDVGFLMYYHSASDSLIVGERDASYNYNIDLFQSQSDGTFLDTSNKVSIATDVNRFSNERILPARDPDDEGRFIFSNEAFYSGGQWNETTLAALESGSEGWKYTAIANMLQDGAGESFSFIDISTAGDIVSNNDVSGTGASDKSDGIFTIRRFSDLGTTFLNDSTSQAIVKADGGTVSAGNTASTPRASVSIPSNALSGDTTIGVDVSDSQVPGALGLGLNGDEALSPIVRLTPHGTTFGIPVTVTFNLIGSGEGTCPANAQLWKRNSESTTWYPVPTNLYSCNNGVITLSTTSFSDYIIIGGQKVARTKLSNVQLARLTENNKVLPEAINITGSGEGKKTDIAGADLLLCQDAASGVSQPISASALATFFAGEGINVVEKDDAVAYSLIFATGTSGAVLSKDTDLTFNASTNLLSGAGAFQAGGAGTFGGKLTISTGGAEVTGAVDLQSTLDVAGALTVDSGGATITAGNVSVASGEISGSSHLKAGGALTVSGAGTFGANVNAVSGALSGDLTVATGLTVSAGGADITGAMSGSGDLSAGGDTILGETLTVNARNKSSASDNALLVEGTSQVKLTANELFKVTNSSNQNRFAVREGGDVEFDSYMVYDYSDRDLKLKNPSNSGETAVLINDGFNGGIISGSSNLLAGGNLTVAGTGTISGDLSVAGDLLIQGATTTVDTTNLLVEDSLIEISRGNGGSRTTNAGAGLYISGSALEYDISLVAAANGGRLKVSGSTAGFDVQVDGDYAINGTPVLTATTLGSSVVNSSLTSLGAQAEALNMNSQNIVSVNDITGSAAKFSGIVSASAFQGNGAQLRNVGASVDDSTDADLALQVPFLSGSGASTTLFIDSGSFTFNPSSKLLGLTAVTASGDVKVGALYIDDVAVSSTSAELNLLDGDTSVGSAVGNLTSTDGIIINDGGVTKLLPLSDLETFMEANLDTMGAQFTSAASLATVGTITTGVWNGTAIATAYIADDAVTADKLNSNVAGSGLEQHTDGTIRIAGAAAGSGLSGGAGSALAVEVSGAVKVASDKVGITGSFAGDGLQAAGGIDSISAMSITYRELVATKFDRGSILDGSTYMTASLTSGDDPLDGSLQVYLNGMLLVQSGSVEVSSSAGGQTAIFDYKYAGSAGSRRVEFVDALDDDDVIQIKYIKK